jgi:hypothetical protein
MISMYVLLITLLICLLFFLYQGSRKIDIVKKSVLSPDECQQLIEIAETLQFETKPDGVDNEPEYQIDILDGTVKNEKLWEICKRIYDTKMPKIDKKLDYVFLKRYRPNERTHIPLHYDDNHTTMSFLLSKPQDFTGGGLYVFSLEESKQLDILDQKRAMTIEDRNILIENYTNLPILKYNHGDMVKYTGGTRMHGTLPITSGERYVLTYFFN